MCAVRDTSPSITPCTLSTSCGGAVPCQGWGTLRSRTGAAAGPVPRGTIPWVRAGPGAMASPRSPPRPAPHLGAELVEVVHVAAHRLRHGLAGEVEQPHGGRGSARPARPGPAAAARLSLSIGGRTFRTAAAAARPPPVHRDRAPPCSPGHPRTQGCRAPQARPRWPGAAGPAQPAPGHPRMFLPRDVNRAPRDPRAPCPLWPLCGVPPSPGSLPLSAALPAPRAGTPGPAGHPLSPLVLLPHLLCAGRWQRAPILAPCPLEPWHRVCCTPQGTPEQSLQPHSQSLGTQNCSAGGTLLPPQLCTETGKGLRGLLRFLGEAAGRAVGLVPPSLHTRCCAMSPATRPAGCTCAGGRKRSQGLPPNASSSSVHGSNRTIAFDARVWDSLLLSYPKVLCVYLHVCLSVCADKYLFVFMLLRSLSYNYLPMCLILCT